MKTNLKQLARYCGVDASTVSRALKNDPRISDATIAKVHEAAAKHGYQPNIAARMLKEGSSRFIWMVVPALGTPVDWRIAERASFSSAKRGYDTAITVHHGSQEDFERIVQNMSAGLAAGAIINRRDIRDITSVKTLIARGFPVVFVDVPVYSLDLGVVTTDHPAATIDLVGASLKAGARQFLFIFDRRRNRVEELRYDGAVQAISRQGLRGLFVTEDTEWREHLIKDGTLAILGNSQEPIMAFYRANEALLAERDIVVACFDEWSGPIHPFRECTVAVQDYDGMADAALEHLFALLENQQPKQKLALPLSELRHYRAPIPIHAKCS